MRPKIAKIYPLLGIFFVFALTFSGCKKNDEVSQPDKLTLVKQKIAGEWELTSGIYIEYDETGKVSYTNKLPYESPAPWYDFRNAETLYLSDRNGRQALAYNISISDNKISKIDIAATSYDIAKTYDITDINDTNMTWVRDLRYDNAGPGFLSRVYTEYNFTKR